MVSARGDGGARYKSVRVIPETARVAIGRIFVGLAVVIGAFIAIVLQGIDTEGLAEHSVDIEVYRSADAASCGASGMQDLRLMAVMFWPVLFVHGRIGRCGELNIGMARSFQLRAGILRRRRIREIDHGGTAAQCSIFGFQARERGGGSNDGTSPVTQSTKGLLQPAESNQGGYLISMDLSSLYIVHTGNKQQSSYHKNRISKPKFTDELTSVPQNLRIGAGERGGRTQGGDIATHLPPLAPSPHNTAANPRSTGVATT